jgi:transposase
MKKSKVKRIIPFRVKQQAIADLEGLELYEVAQKYKVTHNTVRNWKRQVAIGVPGHLLRKRHSVTERAKAVREIESGRLTVDEVMIKYGVHRRNTIKLWLEENSSDLVIDLKTMVDPEKSDQEKSTEEKNRELEKALSEAKLKIASLETLIDVAEKELRIDIRKKPGTKRSK